MTGRMNIAAIVEGDGSAKPLFAGFEPGSGDGGRESKAQSVRVWLDLIRWQGAEVRG